MKQDTQIFSKSIAPLKCLSQANPAVVRNLHSTGKINPVKRRHSGKLSLRTSISMLCTCLIALVASAQDVVHQSNSKTKPSEGNKLEQRLSALRHSGASPSSHTKRLAKLPDEWSEIASVLNIELAVSNVECYAQGCALFTKHRRHSTAKSMLSQFSISDSFLDWPGGVFRAAPEAVANGTLQIAWVFYASENDKVEPLLKREAP